MKKDNNQKILCFYHNADFDGMCSAAIVKYFIPKAILIGHDYNYDFPWKEIDIDTIVYMVDISLNIEDMKKICDLTRAFIYIDHHASKLDEIKNNNLVFKGIQRSDIAACQLVWEWFSNDPCPRAVKMLGDYDVHKLTENVLEFQYGMKCYDISAMNTKFWKQIIENKNDKYIENIINQGRTILKYLKIINKKISNNNSFITYVNGHKAIVINSTEFTSMLFNDYKYINDIDIFIVFCWINNQWKIGFYTNNTNIDVSAIAKCYGGGGHRSAAGCFVDVLPDFINNILHPQELPVS